MISILIYFNVIYINVNCNLASIVVYGSELIYLDSVASLCLLLSIKNFLNHTAPPSFLHSLNNSCVSLAPTIFGLLVNSLFGLGICGLLRQLWLKR